MSDASRLRILSWNINQRPEAFDLMHDGYDVALLQEVPVVVLPTDSSPLIPAMSEDWSTSGWERRRWRTAVATLSPRVTLEAVDCRAFSSEPFDGSTLGISRPGTIAAAHILLENEVVCTVASVYAPWEHIERDPKYIWADGSAHRILSDLEPLILRDPRVPVVVAGDWNIYRGYGEPGWPVFGERYALVFERARLLGLEFVGPKWPNADRQADPRPAEMPADSTCVPTYHTRQQRPGTARNQLDFVFATSAVAGRVSVRARNSADDAEWGPSDHCRIEITVDLD